MFYCFIAIWNIYKIKWKIFCSKLFQKFPTQKYLKYFLSIHIGNTTRIRNLKATAILGAVWFTRIQQKFTLYCSLKWVFKYRFVGAEKKQIKYLNQAKN